ncbi:MAG TPA: dihydropteroate synthase [Candidatus Saccharimonadales bacterium]|nr:dihydropteroate synthase [Candidatus Saccharimonadales bacterium]
MTELVGILNITPDSFSDGGDFFRLEAALKCADQLFADGASLLDIGAESTRPGAKPLTASEEWQRLEPALSKLLPAYPGRISLDSYHPETIERAFTIGSVIVNDVTGLHNPAMVAVVTTLKPRVIISHLPGTDIQAAHQLKPVTSVGAVKADLLATAQQLERAGLARQQIILDPGIGFGKTMELNAQLLSFAAEVPDYEVMIGYSRKRFLGEQRMELEPNLAAGRIAIQSGANYLRVHDVAGHAQLLK